MRQTDKISRLSTLPQFLLPTEAFSEISSSIYVLGRVKKYTKIRNSMRERFLLDLKSKTNIEIQIEKEDKVNFQ